MRTILIFIGVVLESVLSIDKHASNVCRASMYRLLKITSIRNLNSQSTCAKLCHSLVISWMDYLSTLFECHMVCRNKDLDIAARIVTKTPRPCHISPYPETPTLYSCRKKRIVYTILVLKSVNITKWYLTT